MNKELYFINKTFEYCSKMKIKIPFVQRDNRIKGIALVYSLKNCKTNKINSHLLKYNKKKLHYLPKWLLLHSVFHELGHMTTDAKTEQEREYKAEQFAQKAIRKYYPKYHKKSLVWLKSWKDSNRKTHREAYLKLLKELT